MGTKISNEDDLVRAHLYKRTQTTHMGSFEPACGYYLDLVMSPHHSDRENYEMFHCTSHGTARFARMQKPIINAMSMKEVITMQKLDDVAISVGLEANRAGLS